MIVWTLPELALAALLAAAPSHVESTRAPDAGIATPVAAAPVSAATLPAAASTAAIAAPAPVAAAGDSARLDSIVVLPEVRVERDRLRSDVERRSPTGSTSELAAHRSGRALETLGELLAAAPGVHVEQYGGLGAFSTVSLRGAPSDQVAVYLDGMPLTGAAQSVADLSDLPYGAIERVDVYRGTSPLALGAAPGGAIDLVTRHDARGLELRGAAGSFGSWEGGATTGLARGATHLLLHVSGQGSRGDFPYLDDNGTPFNVADDSVHARINAGFQSMTALAALEWAPAGAWRARVQEHLFRKWQGVPGLGAIPAADTRFGLTHSLTRLGLARSGRAWTPSLALDAGLGRDWTHLEDTKAELGLGTHDTHDRLDDALARAGLGWSGLPLGVTFEASGDVRRESARLSDTLDGHDDPPPSRRDAVGAMLALGWRAPGDRLEMRAARRWDRLWDRLNAGTTVGTVATEATRTLDAPQLGARARLGLGLEARVNWSRAAHAPDFTELFGDQGSVLGNPALVPETGENRDAGLAWNAPAAWPVAMSAGWTVFDSRLTNLILYVRNSQSSVRAQNISRARIRGHEGTLRVLAPGGLSATLAFTTQQAVDEGPVPYWNGRRLPQHPEHEGDLRLDWTHRAWGAGASLEWLGDDYLDRYNRYRVAARRLMGATLRAPLVTPSLVLTLEGKNLTDDRASDVAGFPLPGRGFFVALETQLGSAPAPAPR
ncbi:MAG: TonB-dependent receptor [Candidatus Eisenbacteria bacterium]